MFSIRNIVFGICFVTGMCVFAEQHCSRYHYEEQILSKQIRIEIQLENLKNAVLNLQEHHQQRRTCDDEWVTFRNSCYWFGTTTMDFSRAKAVCESLGSGLVNIRNSTENDFFTRHASANYWIGITDNDTEGTWVWSGTGEVAHFVNWNSGEPNEGTGEKCARAAKSNGKWADVPCTYTYIPICNK